MKKKTNKKSVNEAIVAHVVPPLHCGEDALCKLIKAGEEVIENDDDDEEEDSEYRNDKLFFVFQQMKYIYNDETNTFEELDFPIEKPIKHYISNGLSKQEAKQVCFFFFFLRNFAIDETNSQTKNTHKRKPHKAKNNKNNICKVTATVR